MLLQKAIEVPHRMPKLEELKGRQYCKWHNSWNHSTNGCVVFGDVIREEITTGKLKLARKAAIRYNKSFSPTRTRQFASDEQAASSYRPPGHLTSFSSNRPKACGCEKPRAESARPKSERVWASEERTDYDGELDEETKSFGAELESLLQGDLDINMVFILPEKFRATEGQENTLEGDVISQESFECRLAEVEEEPEKQTAAARIGRTDEQQLCFSRPTKEMANHLRPLFITANFGGIPVAKVMVDGGAAINLLPHGMLSKMGEREKDLIPTRLTVTNFALGASPKLMEY
ncbi:unnamed protein product [Prunus brigantina]